MDMALCIQTKTQLSWVCPEISCQWDFQELGAKNLVLSFEISCQRYIYSCYVVIENSFQQYVDQVKSIWEKVIYGSRPSGHGMLRNNQRCPTGSLAGLSTITRIRHFLFLHLGTASTNANPKSDRRSAGLECSPTDHRSSSGFGVLAQALLECEYLKWMLQNSR
jgi:hypothetical protein